MYKFIPRVSHTQIYGHTDTKTTFRRLQYNENQKYTCNFRNTTAMSKYIWTINLENNSTRKLDRAIVRSKSYAMAETFCSLYQEENLAILMFLDPSSLLNKRENSKKPPYNF